MKLTIDRRDFSDAVAFVARMSPKRTTNPILAGVLLTAEGEELRLTVYDYEIAAETSIVASVPAEGVALVHAGMLAQVAAKLPQKPVSLETVDKALKITCGSVKASLPLMPAEEYPKPDFVGQLAATMSGAVFEDAVQRVAPSASTEAQTPILLGVHVVIDADGITFAATDRYRVAHMPITCDTAEAAELVIAASVLREAAKAFGPSEEVEIGVTGNSAATIRGERGAILARTLTGKYPPVVRLFPKDAVSTAVVDREATSEATQRAALALEPEGAVRYVFSADECSVSGVSDADGKGVSEEFEIEHDGDEYTVNLKPQFVVDGLTACRAEKVSLTFTPGAAPGKPGPVMFASGDGFRYLLQPNLLLK